MNVKWSFFYALAGNEKQIEFCTLDLLHAD